MILKDYWSALVSSLKISKLFSAKGTVNRLREHCSLSSSNCLWFPVEVLFPGKVSYLQIPTFWLMEVVVFVLAVVWKRIQQLPTMLRPAVHRGKDTAHKTLAGRPCVMRVRAPTMLKELCKKDPSFRYNRRSRKNLKGILGVT